MRSFVCVTFIWQGIVNYNTFKIRPMAIVYDDMMYCIVYIDHVCDICGDCETDLRDKLIGGKASRARLFCKNKSTVITFKRIDDRATFRDQVR